jgi:hypothetical protein
MSLQHYLLQFSIDRNGFVNCNDEAVWHMVAGLAPRLRYVHMLDRVSLVQNTGRMRDPWSGFFVDSPVRAAGKVKGQLRSLAAYRLFGSLTEAIPKWENHTDLAKALSA